MIYAVLAQYPFVAIYVLLCGAKINLNIARGTTDPEIESVHLSNLLNNSIYNNKW